MRSLHRYSILYYLIMSHLVFCQVTAQSSLQLHCACSASFSCVSVAPPTPPGERMKEIQSKPIRRRVQTIAACKSYLRQSWTEKITALLCSAGCGGTCVYLSFLGFVAQKVQRVTQKRKLWDRYLHVYSDGQSGRTYFGKKNEYFTFFGRSKWLFVYVLSTALRTFKYQDSSLRTHRGI